jgi:hypothetical protein
MNTNFPIKRDMSQLLSLVQAEYDREASSTEYFRRKYEEFRKDEEIQRLEAEIARLHRLSLHRLSEKERKDEQDFRHTHYERCGNGNDYVYELIGTGIGTVIYITCPVCGERKDITDIGDW